MDWKLPLDSGGLMVGRSVPITIEARVIEVPEAGSTTTPGVAEREHGEPLRTRPRRARVTASCYIVASTCSSASPSRTSRRSWFVTFASTFTRLFMESTFVTFTVAVSVSPGFTGAR